MKDIPSWLGILATIIGIAGGVGAAVAVFRQQAIKASLATIIEANAELREANKDLRQELEAERQKRAALEGKLDLFTDHFAQQIVSAVIETVRQTSPFVAINPKRPAGARTRTTDQEPS